MTRFSQFFLAVVYPAIIATSCVALDEDSPITKKLSEAQNNAEHCPGGIWREKVIEEFEVIKKSTSDKDARFAADYWIGQTIFKCDWDVDKNYEPYPRFVKHIEYMEKEYPQFDLDVRMASLRLRYHDFNFTRNEDQERKFLLNFLADGIKKLSYPYGCGFDEGKIATQAAIYLSNLEELISRMRGGTSIEGVTKAIAEAKERGAPYRALGELDAIRAAMEGDRVAALKKRQEAVAREAAAAQKANTSPVVQPPIQAESPKVPPVGTKVAQSEIPAQPAETVVQPRQRSGPSITVFALLAIATVAFFSVIIFWLKGSGR